MDDDANTGAMIVPAFWGEARLQVKHNGRNVTVRRFGWADDSQASADLHALERAQASLDLILAGHPVRRREQRTNYGVLGVPIREQIVSRQADGVIVTRNSYGALCLNAPNVLFADVDFEPRPTGCAVTLAMAPVGLLVGLAAGLASQTWGVGAVAALATLLALHLVLSQWRRWRHAHAGGGPEARTTARIAAFALAHPDWHLRVYRTPAGLRVLAMQRTFDPLDPEVEACFHALGADRLYATLCKVQRCFRARLSAKPWRAGVRSHIRPVKAAWSSDQARRPDRLAWIAAYEAQASAFSACHFVESLGDTSRVDPAAQRVAELHDAMSGAFTRLPLA